MTKRQLLKTCRQFREGMIGDACSDLMCFMVCAPLQAYLSMAGVQTKLVEVRLPSHEWAENHIWLEMPDGTIIDPTADQFGLAPIYIGPLPPEYVEWQKPAKIALAPGGGET